MGTVKHLARCLEPDLAVLLPAMDKSPREKLATMAACLIETRSCNTMELAARLPIETDRAKSRYAWIERFLSAETIDDRGVMEAMTRRLLATLSAQGQTLIVSIDQTSRDAGRALAMMAARVGERAGLSSGASRTRTGTCRLKTICRPELIAACQRHGFRYRIRLKGNLSLLHDGGELSVDDIPRLGLKGVVDGDLGKSGVRTNIGFVHDNGHKAAWFIAMDAVPSRIPRLITVCAGALSRWFPTSNHPASASTTLIAAHRPHLAHVAGSGHRRDVGDCQRPVRSKKPRSRAA